MPCGSCAQGHGAPFKAEVAISAIENQQRCTSRLVTSPKTQFDRQIRRRTWHRLEAGPNHISKKDRSGGLKRADHTWHETQTVSKFENDFIVITRRWLRPRKAFSGCWFAVAVNLRLNPAPFPEESLMRTRFCAVITIRSLILVFAFREFHGPAARDPSNLWCFN